MLRVVWGEYKLQEGCVMALMVSEGNEESLVGFWLSKASKLPWFTGFRKFPEIRIIFLQKIQMSKLMACFQWNLEFHNVQRSSCLSFFVFAKCSELILVCQILWVLLFGWWNHKPEIDCITAVHQFLFNKCLQNPRNFRMFLIAQPSFHVSCVFFEQEKQSETATERYLLMHNSSLYSDKQYN